MQMQQYEPNVVIVPLQNIHTTCTWTFTVVLFMEKAISHSMNEWEFPGNPVGYILQRVINSALCESRAKKLDPGVDDRRYYI